MLKRLYFWTYVKLLTGDHEYAYYILIVPVAFQLLQNR